MARRKQPTAIRLDLQRLFVRGVLLCTAGVFMGWALGEMIAVDRNDAIPASLSSFSDLSSNPKALAAPPADGSPPCLDCADSYGATMRLRAARAERMDAAIRELGAIDAEGATAERPTDGYRYGGRFPDPTDADDPSREVAETGSGSRTPSDQATRNDEVSPDGDAD